MKYVKKDIEQLIKTNIGIKIRKLKYWVTFCSYLIFL